MTEQEDVVALLKAASAAVDAAEIPDDLRTVAFERAYERLAGVAPPAAPAPQPQVVRGGPAAGGDGGDGGGDSLSAKLARKLDVDEAIVNRVLDFDDDGVHLIVSRAKLDTQRQAAMQEVARLVVAARQGAGLDEEWTNVDVIRAACDNRGVLDGSNFAAAVKRLDGNGFRVRGSTARQRQFKINQAGYESTADLVKRLAS